MLVRSRGYAFPRPSRATALTRRFALAASILLLAGCSDPAAPDREPVGGIRVLFIGNSLTYYNDLPHMVEELAASVGDTVAAYSVTHGGFALIDHILIDNTAVAAVNGADWDWVVMQQGPTWPGIYLDTLILAATQFATLARDAGATPAIYEVWPSADDLMYFSSMASAFRQAADAVDGVYLPAGDAWVEAWARAPGLELYGGDLFHPSRIGSYLAAVVMYEHFTGRDARELPDVPVGAAAIEASAETVRLLHEVAHEVNAREGMAGLRVGRASDRGSSHR